MTEIASSTNQRVSKYWRSLDELENSQEFQEFVHREFPQAASEFPEGVSRRRWMQLMGASFTLAAAQGCRWQTEKFAAFSERPEGYIPGSHTKYATNIEVAGAPRHLLVTCYDGRPIKVDGNGDHPDGSTGSDVYSQALTLSLYDPDRQSTPLERDGQSTAPRTWADFEAFARGAVERLQPKSGAGLAVLVPPTASLAVTATLDRLVAAMPETALFEYAPLSRDNELAGAEMAFGKRVRTHYRLADADIIACFDADLLGSFPESTKLAGAYAERREPDAEKNPAGMNRLYAVESQFTVTGASADHRLAVKTSSIPSVLAGVRDAVASILAGQEPIKPTAAEGESLEYSPAFYYALAEDLAGSEGCAVVAVGSQQSAEAHAIAHEINALIGAVGKTVVYTDEPKLAKPVGSLAELLGKIAEKRVDTLVILGGNPIYDAPSELDVAELLDKVPHTVHLSEYDNETSRVCQWSLPETHALEAWGAVAAWSGTIGVSQPMIDPLLGGWSAMQLLSLLIDGPGQDAKELVRKAVESKAGPLDDSAWNKLLHDGYLEGQSPAVTAELVRTGFEAPAAPAAEELELVFTPSSHTYDGRFANNGWLQETPDFITKLTWDNAALVSPETAADLGVKQGQLVRLKVTTESAGESVERRLDAPVFIQPGQARGSIALALGYGRTAAGRVGGMIREDGSRPRRELVKGERGNWGRYLSLLGVSANPVGADSYQLRTSATMTYATGVTVEQTGKTYLLATTQDHHAIDEVGLHETVRRSGELIREATVGEFEEKKDDYDHGMFVEGVGAHVPDVELWSELSHDEGRAWGMAIDLNKCIGCNACSVACQAENNVPVVGKDQVARGREMHWIRIDRYFSGTSKKDAEGNPIVEALSGNAKIDFSNPRVAHQPLTCQHCETAPCEQVCPVAATIHSDEGLNDMVYNRCIGTRYCANNCPFKVRRFNFFHYTDRFDDANNELMRLVMNPEVTVRSRGVMEKCTYCTQRISAARIKAKNEGRAVRDGDVRTACQDACSTNAIVFGDLNDAESEVAAWHKNERAYALLDGLRLKPRTKYLGRIFNPHELLEPFMELATVFNPPHHTDEHHGDEHHDDEHHGDGEGEGHGQGEEGHSEEHDEKQARGGFRFGQLPIVS